MTVSVILPVFKVERYIERCLRSLMEQTFQDVEFIIVDDASPDSSMAIARKVVSEYGRNVRFLEHQTNRGLPAARNTGLDAACGEFIYHCDSDDWLEHDMIEKMVSAARDNDADFVYCDLFLSFSGRERPLRQPDYTDKFDALQEGLLTGNMKHNVWNKLIRRSLYNENGIKSPEIHCKGGEDFMIIKLLRLAKRIAHVKETLYHYNRTNVNAITKTGSEHHYEDIKANADDVIAFLNVHPVPEPVFLQFFKLDVKLPLLMERDRKQFRRWQSWYPEANDFILENNHVSFRTRMLELSARHGFYPIVWLYATMVDIYYKVRYRK